MPSLRVVLLASRWLLAGLLLASPVLAEPAPLVRSRNVLVTVDRLLGLSHTVASSDDLQGLSSSWLDAKAGLALLSPNQNNPYATPTLGLHYSFLTTLTAGLGFGFSRESGVSNAGLPSATDRPPRTTMVVAPRLGYLMEISGRFSLWGRGGVTYVQVSAHSQGGSMLSTFTQQNSLQALSLSLEPTLVATLIDHVGLTLALVGDLGVAGSLTRDTHTTIIEGPREPNPDRRTEESVRLSNVGLQVGALGYF